MSDTILLLGATGFVGGHILHTLLTKPFQNLAKIIVVTSSDSKVKQVQRWHKDLKASSDKLELEVVAIDRNNKQEWHSGVQQYSSKVHLVIQAATSDELELTKAINRGLVQGRKNGKKGTLVHLSGVQLIESRPVGKYVETPNYDDSDAKQIQSIPEDAAHRLIDLEIGNAITRGDFYGSIVCPALIWGLGAGPGSRISGLMPDMVKKSLYNKQATYVGDGMNRWVHIHVDEVVDLILKLGQDHLAHPDKKSKELFDSFYFGSHKGLVDFMTMAKAIGRVLKRRGIAETDEPKSVPAPPVSEGQKGVRIEDEARSNEDPEVDKMTPSWACRTNCRCIAKRGEEELGWKATREYDDKAMEQDVEDALPFLL